MSAMQAMAARLSDRWDIVAGAFSSNPEKAKAAAADWFLPQERCYASFEEMAQAEANRPDGVDAVMITTPNHLHHPAALAFLEAGIDVLCDKPLTNEISEAEALLKAARGLPTRFRCVLCDVLFCDHPASARSGNVWCDWPDQSDTCRVHAGLDDS